MTQVATCPGCGLDGLLGPFDADEGIYYECHACGRHVMADEAFEDEGDAGDDRPWGEQQPQVDWLESRFDGP
jgi:hypothetical protein